MSLHQKLEKKISGNKLIFLEPTDMLGGEGSVVTPDSMEGGDHRKQQTLHLDLDFTKSEELEQTTQQIASAIGKVSVHDQTKLRPPVPQTLNSKLDSSTESSSSTIEQSYTITESKPQTISLTSSSGTPPFTDQILVDLNNCKGESIVCPNIPDKSMVSGVIGSNGSQSRIGVLRKKGSSRFHSHVSTSTIGRSESTSRRTKSSSCLTNSQSKHVDAKDESRKRIQDPCIAIENKTYSSIERLSSFHTLDVKTTLVDTMESVKDSCDLRSTRVETTRKPLNLDSRTKRTKKVEPDINIEVPKPDLVKGTSNVLASKPIVLAKVKQLDLPENTLNGKHTRESQQLSSDTSPEKETKGGKMNPNKRNLLSGDRNVDRPRSSSRRNARLS